MKRLILFTALVLTGCQAAIYGTAQDMNKLSIGMSKAEVIETLGTPNSTAANEHVEFLIYRKMAAVVSDWPRDYFVKLQDGKVVAYGKKGDFDSTKDPALNLNVTDNSKSQ